jgi:hypothetical protein
LYDLLDRPGIPAVPEQFQSFQPVDTLTVGILYRRLQTVTIIVEGPVYKIYKLHIWKVY